MFGNTTFSHITLKNCSDRHDTLENTIGAKLLRKFQCKCSFLKAM